MSDVDLTADGIECLVLTKEQADAIVGATQPGAALIPIALADGVRFVLPVAVLGDPAHAMRRDALSAFPVILVERSAFTAGPFPGG